MSKPPQAPGKWVTPQEAASVWNRHVRVIQRWCATGLFAEAHIRTHFDSTAPGQGQWWICLPPELEATRTTIVA